MTKSKLEKKVFILTEICRGVAVNHGGEGEAVALQSGSRVIVVHPNMGNRTGMPHQVEYVK